MNEVCKTRGRLTRAQARDSPFSGVVSWPKHQDESALAVNLPGRAASDARHPPRSHSRCALTAFPPVAQAGPPELRENSCAGRGRAAAPSLTQCAMSSACSGGDTRDRRNARGAAAYCGECVCA